MEEDGGKGKTTTANFDESSTHSAHFIQETVMALSVMPSIYEEHEGISRPRSSFYFGLSNERRSWVLRTVEVESRWQAKNPGGGRGRGRDAQVRCTIAWIRDPVGGQDSAEEGWPI